MKWSQPADRRVVEAVAASFREPVGCPRALFSALSQKQWEQTYYWLDASGIALYLLSRIERLGLEDAIPAATLARLKQNLTDNTTRSASMYREYVDLNRSFQEQGVDYCNLKGFTLYPDSCPDPTLRCQLDFDLLIDGSDLEACEAVLLQRGYILRGSTDTVREYKTDGDQLAVIADFYKPKQQRCVELHFKCETSPHCLPIRDERLDRLTWRHDEAISFPSLCAVDQFVGQAVHLFGHICSPNTRLAWLLEHKWNIEAHATDPAFWIEVRTLTASDESSALAVGACSLLVRDLFNVDLPASLDEIAATCVPEGVALWLGRYGRRAVLADFPGTKLNLLLREQITRTSEAWRLEKRKALLPLSRPPRIVHFAEGVGMKRRLRGEMYQLRYAIFRLHFHVVEGVRYALEAARWRRHLKRSQSPSQRASGRQSQTTAKHI